MHVLGRKDSNKLLAQILSQCKKAGKAAIASWRTKNFAMGMLDEVEQVM